ncbi:DUF5050 domain-containing protein [Clostridium sp. CF012]|uniref:DUF5050 domain-containing protein n=1 Tax=Clostridium sp. CF012 TaxID=2843319 RepID=UPI001C0AB813|nr:DUF5050 domain-containing protein [Clostridium sp. CF012]MBU3146553.1 DUF5050 domain-containing protein [Clostridium sp. CF012]
MIKEKKLQAIDKAYYDGKINIEEYNYRKISDDTCYKINYSGNYIYYLKYEDVAQPIMTSIYRIKVDGTENMKTVM